MKKTHVGDNREHLFRLQLSRTPYLDGETEVRAPAYRTKRIQDA